MSDTISREYAKDLLNELAHYEPDADFADDVVVGTVYRDLEYANSVVVCWFHLERTGADKLTVGDLRRLVA